MRGLLFVCSLYVVAINASAQEKPKPVPRFGVAAEPEVFPQDAPKPLLSSIQKALERKRIDYLIAHLLDPTFSERKIDEFYRQRFGRSRDEDAELSREQRDQRRVAEVAFGRHLAASDQGVVPVKKDGGARHHAAERSTL